MPNQRYPKAAERQLTTGLNLAAGVVKAQLIDLAEYTFNAAHEFLVSVPSAARIGAPVTLTGKSVTDGVFDAADVTFSGLTSAPSIEALLIYVEVTNDADSYLLHLIDTATGLPIAAGATGGSVTWDNGANKIFRV